MTFVILASFAAIVGVLTDSQVHTQFNEQESSAVNQLYSELNGKLSFDGLYLDWKHTRVSLSDFAGSQHAQIRIFDASDG
ncbi:MAG TPA: hypothetical protein VGI07_05135, partial [Solirubrobacteraceae bacterium]